MSDDEEDDDDDFKEAGSSSDGEEDPAAPSHADPMGIEARLLTFPTVAEPSPRCPLPRSHARHAASPALIRAHHAHALAGGVQEARYGEVRRRGRRPGEASISLPEESPHIPIPTHTHPGDRSAHARPPLSQAASMRIFGAEPLTVFKSNRDDPYITLPDSDDESEKQDDVIRDTGAR